MPILRDWLAAKSKVAKRTGEDAREISIEPG